MAIEEPAEVQFREFHPSDAIEFTRIAKEAWPAGSFSIPSDFNRAMVELYVPRSSWKQVATVLDRPVGLLFGRIRGDYSTAARLKAFLVTLGFYLKIGLGAFKGLPHRFTFLSKLAITELKFGLYVPKSDGEVTLFIVDPQFQGRGIGRGLLDSFVSEAREKGAKKLVVCTDQDSNWGFYEHYGFSRRVAFFDDFDSYVKGEEVLGFVYELDLTAPFSGV